MWRLEKCKFWFRVNIHNLTNRRQKLFFLSHQYVRRKLELFARRKTSSVNTVFELSSGFCSVSRLFRQPWHSRVFMLSYFSISVTISYSFAYMTFVLINCMYGLSFAVIHLTLTSIPAGFWTQLWPVLLSVLYCKLVFSFPLHLPHLSSTYTRYQFRIFLTNSVLIPNNNQRRFSHSLGNSCIFTSYD